MNLRRDAAGTVWVVDDQGDELPLEDLTAGNRTDLLDELVHDAKAEEAALLNNAGEQAQIAYLLGE